jgi:hypothetical protein
VDELVHVNGLNGDQYQIESITHQGDLS